MHCNNYYNNTEIAPWAQMVIASVSSEVQLVLRALVSDQPIGTSLRQRGDGFRRTYLCNTAGPPSQFSPYRRSCPYRTRANWIQLTELRPRRTPGSPRLLCGALLGLPVTRKLSV